MNKIYLLSLLAIALFLNACSDDTPNLEQSFVSNADVDIQVSEFRKEIQITVEVLEDTTDGILDDPGDNCTIAIDLNHNSQKDDSVDIGFGSMNSVYDICAFHFLDNDALTPCGGYESEATFTGVLEASDKNETPHIIWTFTIPKSELGDEDKLTFAVKTFSNGDFNTYPKNALSNHPVVFEFNDFFVFEW